MMTPQEIIACVERLERASDQARGWMSPGGTCCAPPTRANGYCTNPACVARAVRYSCQWATEAAHEAKLLIALAELASELLERVR